MKCFLPFSLVVTCSWPLAGGNSPCNTVCTQCKVQFFGQVYALGCGLTDGGLNTQRMLSWFEVKLWVRRSKEEFVQFNKAKILKLLEDT